MKDEQLQSQVSIFGINLFMAITALALVIALVGGATPVVILCICILVMSYGAKMWAKASLRKIHASLETDRMRLFPEDHFRLDVKMENGKLLPVLAGFSVDSDMPEISGQAGFQEAALWGYSEFFGQWEIKAGARGVYRVGPIRATAGDLLGFYQIEKKFELQREIVVYPKLIEVRQTLPVSREYFGSNPGSAFVEDPVLIAGTRECGLSTPARAIHWKASSKRMTWQKKILQSSSHMKVLIAIDVRGFQENGAYDDFEEMLSAAASYSVFLSQRGIVPSLAVNGFLKGDEVPVIASAEGTDQIHRILEKLARLTVEHNEKFDPCLFGEGAGNQTCLYFCRRPPDDLKRGQRYGFLEVVTCFPGETGFDQPPCKVVGIRDFIRN